MELSHRCFSAVIYINESKGRFRATPHRISLFRALPFTRDKLREGMCACVARKSLCAIGLSVRQPSNQSGPPDDP